MSAGKYEVLECEKSRQGLLFQENILTLSYKRGSTLEAVQHTLLLQSLNGAWQEH